MICFLRAVTTVAKRNRNKLIDFLFERITNYETKSTRGHEFPLETLGQNTTVK